jgi:hypothetical protein
MSVLASLLLTLLLPALAGAVLLSPAAAVDSEPEPGTRAARTSWWSAGSPRASRHG